jgi:hypothetical protein
MKLWPWSKPDPDQVERLREADAAKHSTAEELDRVRRQWPAVHDARRQLDGLGAQIERAMRSNRA